MLLLATTATVRRIRRSVLLTTTLSLHLFVCASPAESIIVAVCWLALWRRRLRSCNVYLTPQHESSRIRASSTGDSLISGEVSYTGWTLSTRFSSESGFRCSGVCTTYMSTFCQPVSSVLFAAICDQLTVVTWTSLVSHYISLLSNATLRPVSSLSISRRSAFGFFYNKALYKSTVIITSDKGGGICFCMCLFVCLSVCLSVCTVCEQDYSKKECMDLDEMLRVDRCRDMDELINFWAQSGL